MSDVIKTVIVMIFFASLIPLFLNVCNDVLEKAIEIHKYLKSIGLRDIEVEYE